MRLVCGLAALALLGGAADKKLPIAQASNERLAITATLYQDKDSIKQLLGNDLGGYFWVVSVELSPKSGAVAVSRDDFLLRSYKDGQKSGPFAPSQIAGRGALVVSSTYQGGGLMSEDRGPVWGGIPGTGGRPQRVGTEPPVMGSAPAQSSAQATVDSGAKQPENPVLAVLKEKVLAEKKIEEPLSGLLYFSLEGKHKPKDLALQYRGPAGKLDLQFR